MISISKMMSTFPIQIPTICIRRVFHRVTDRVLYGTFERLLGKGCIADLQMLPRRDNNTGEPYHLVFIRFNEYTPRPMISRSGTVSPTLEFDDQGVVETAEATGDELYHRITKFVTRLETEEYLRVEYRAPHYFKVRKYAQRAPRVKQVPRILPSSVVSPQVCVAIGADGVSECVPMGQVTS
tara:strand:+ start:434 stop:979 length:546 start_codon:yes stop_codon:yes gene_type:complete